MKADSKRLLLATNNEGKLTELSQMLTGFGVELLSLRDFNQNVDVAETGSTTRENARIKASGYAIQTGVTALADDSGLEIAVLGGRPGVHSARYGGMGTSFEAKMAALLQELTSTEDRLRTARFICSIVVSSPTGEILCESEGVCEGRIAQAPRGSGGFGYDPIFIPEGYDLTFGDLPGSVKQEISHRSRAFRSIIPFLRDFIAD